MSNPILIIHGWSDNYKSFEPLKLLLQAQNAQTHISDIWLGDYESMQDDVSFDDLSQGLQERLEDLVASQKISLQPFSLDIIVHSTGGPVVRNWLNHYLIDICKGDFTKCPVRHFIMLAPANFGSRLAAQGKSALAKLFKGGLEHGFQTGRHILEGLELGSPFSWQLAERDLFSGHKMYPCDADKGPFIYILSGTETYGTLKGLVATGANEAGSDGTVRAAAASLDSIKLEIDYSEPTKPHIIALAQLNDAPVFKLLEGFNHSTIVPDAQATLLHPTFTFIQACLAVKNASEHQELRFKFLRENNALYQKPGFVNRYQQFVVRIQDNMKNAVTDYRLDFHVINDLSTPSSWQKQDIPKQLAKYADYTAEMMDKVISDVQKHSVDASYRTFFINIDAYEALIDELNSVEGKPYIAMNLDAMPAAPGVTYRTDELKYAPLNRLFANKTGKYFFKENTTTLIDITLHLNVENNVFNLID